MSNRKLRKDESLQEYFLKMKEIASRGMIEDDALMQYVIDGIQNLTMNKSILYGATNLKDFKAKLKCYEVMHEKSKCRPEAGLIQQKVLSGKTELKRDNCYNCGEKGHNAKNCLSKDKGTICFR